MTAETNTEGERHHATGPQVAEIAAALRGTSAARVGTVHRVWLASLVVIGCHAKGSTMESPDADVGPDASAVGGICHAVVTHETPLLAASHVTQGTAVDWPSNPPTSGPHYPTLVDWATPYPVAVMRGNYLHNEEHGGVVLLFNCPGGCGDPMTDLTQFGQALPQDPLCATINARWIVTPDPLLETGVAIGAATWGWTYKADCFDPVTLGAFVAAHYAQGGADRTNCTTGVPIQ